MKHLLANILKAKTKIKIMANRILRKSNLQNKYTKTYREKYPKLQTRETRSNKMVRTISSIHFRNKEKESQYSLTAPIKVNLMIK